MKKFFTTQKANLVGNLEGWFNFATPPFEPKNLGDFNITRIQGESQTFNSFFSKQCPLILIIENSQQIQVTSLINVYLQLYF